MQNIFFHLGQDKISGAEVKLRLKQSGIPLGELAKRLHMTRQNLGYHLRKDAVDMNFLASLENEVKIDFTSKPRPAVEKEEDDIDLIAQYSGRIALHIKKVLRLENEVIKISTKLSGHESRLSTNEERIDKIFDIIVDLRRSDGRIEDAIKKLLQKVDHA